MNFERDLQLQPVNDDEDDDFVIWPARLNQALKPELLWVAMVAEHFYGEKSDADDEPQKFYTWFFLADPVSGQSDIINHLTSDGKNKSIHVLGCFHISQVLQAQQHIHLATAIDADQVLGKPHLLSVLTAKKFVAWSASVDDVNEHNQAQPNMRYWVVSAQTPGRAAAAVVALSGGDKVFAISAMDDFEVLVDHMLLICRQQQFDQIQADVRQGPDALSSRDLAIKSQKALRHAILKEWAIYVQENGVDQFSGPGPE